MFVNLNVKFVRNFKRARERIVDEERLQSMRVIDKLELFIIKKKNWVEKGEMHNKARASA